METARRPVHIPLEGRICCQCGTLSVGPKDGIWDGWMRMEMDCARPSGDPTTYWMCPKCTQERFGDSR